MGMQKPRLKPTKKQDKRPKKMLNPKLMQTLMPVIRKKLQKILVKMPLLQKVVKRETNPKENQEVVVVIPGLKLKLILHPYRFHNYFPVAIILKAKLWTTQSQMMMPRQNRDLQVKRQEL